MHNRFTPAHTYPDRRSAGSPARLTERFFDIVFAVGWWYFLTELGHTFIVAAGRGCYCDFSQPDVPCSGIYMLLFEIIILAAVCLPLFIYFFRGMYIEKVGLGKKAVILLASAALAFLLPYLLQALEAGFAALLPDVAAAAFTPWADPDIVRFVRMRG